MKLRKDDLSLLFEYERYLRSRISKDLLISPEDQEEYRSMIMDLNVANEIIKHGETIIFSSETMRQLLQNIDRIDTRGDLYLPYPYILIQFTEPMPEEEIMDHVELNDWQIQQGMDKDWVEMLMIANPDQDPTWERIPGLTAKRNCIAWFTSTSLNRVSWQVSSEEAEIVYANSSVAARGLIHEENKRRLIKLAYLISLFLNAPNVIVKSIKHPQVIQMKRERKGKKKLPEYHTVTILKTVYESSGPKKPGTTHSYYYPVRGHFRRIKGYDNPIWIPNHFRGLKHMGEESSRSIYKVRKSKEE